MLEQSKTLNGTLVKYAMAGADYPAVGKMAFLKGFFNVMHTGSCFRRSELASIILFVCLSRQIMSTLSPSFTFLVICYVDRTPKGLKL